MKMCVSDPGPLQIWWLHLTGAATLSAAKAQHLPTREAPGSEQLKQQDQPAGPKGHADREPSHTLSHPQAGSPLYTASQVLLFSS